MVWHQPCPRRIPDRPPGMGPAHGRRHYFWALGRPRALGRFSSFLQQDNVFLLTWRLLTGTVRTRYWLCCFSKKEICQCGCFGRHTLDTIFAVAAWSMRTLLAGQYPKVDHEGHPCAPASYSW